MAKQHIIHLQCGHQTAVKRVMGIRFQSLPATGSRHYCGVCKEYRIVLEVRHVNVQGG